MPAVCVCGAESVAVVAAPNEPVASAPDRKPHLLDLSAVEFVTSATLGVMTGFAEQCREQGRPLALASLRPFRRDQLSCVVIPAAPSGPSCSGIFLATA